MQFASWKFSEKWFFQKLSSLSYKDYVNWLKACTALIGKKTNNQCFPKTIWELLPNNPVSLFTAPLMMTGNNLWRKQQSNFRENLGKCDIMKRKMMRLRETKYQVDMMFPHFEFLSPSSSCVWTPPWYFESRPPSLTYITPLVDDLPLGMISFQKNISLKIPLDCQSSDVHKIGKKCSVWWKRGWLDYMSAYF